MMAVFLTEVAVVMALHPEPILFGSTPRKHLSPETRKRRAKNMAARKARKKIRR